MRNVRWEVWARQALLLANTILLQKVPRSLQNAPRKRSSLGRLAPDILRSEQGEGGMSVQLSQRGRHYMETARTLLRAAQTMTDRAVASQLKALADDYERHAEKASQADTAIVLARGGRT